MNKIDLHIHSSFSDDADFSVNELITMAVNEGVDLLSITDHNSARSVREISIPGRNYGVRTLSGIEIDCTFENNNYHLLGYGFNLNSNDFDALESDFNKMQHEITPQKIERLRKLGFKLDEERLYALAGEKVPQEEQMAELILEDPRNDGHELLLPYRIGNTRSDMPLINFFWDFFGKGKSCYVEMTLPTMSTVVDMIVSNGGIPVIAHIGANVKEKHLSVINKMLTVGVQGIEVFSSYHSEKLRQELYSYALDNSLLVTCGSDFHGRNKPKITLGCCQPWQEAESSIQKFLDNVSIH
ncbi:PHP domain-containing protein [Pseudocitrobacter corydidari]